MTSRASNTGNYSRVRGNGLFLTDKPQSRGVNTDHAGASNNQNGVRKLPAISSRKIRERLVHLLAIKPHTKSELFSILQNEGLRNCERSVIVIVLRDVTQLYHNEYRLRHHIWREVDVNWPYYSDKEQQQLKWLKEQNLRAPNSSDEVTSISSCSPASTSSSTPPQQYDNSHTIKQVQTLKRPNVNVNEPQPSKRIRTDNTTIHNNINSQSATNSSAVANNFDFSNYTKITNLEQRHQYKHAFDRYYREYIPLWQHIEELDRSFGELGGQILKVSVEHPDYVQIKQRIVEKYDRINSEKEIRRKQRCDYLHAKLAHIKQLVTIYDNKRAEEAALAAEMAKARQYQLTQQPTPKPAEIPNTKAEYADFLGTDLALSESDTDEE